jgi:cytidine deaminase
VSGAAQGRGEPEQAPHEQRLRVLAERSAARAYAPYSRFKVGAALLTRSGRVFVGCNVENASYGGTVCAERNAVGAAVVAGETDIVAIVVFTHAERPTPPCGICRQVLIEFNPTMQIVSYNAAGLSQRWVANELLPASFSRRDLDPDFEHPVAADPPDTADDEPRDPDP